MSSKVRVLVIDDSALARQLISAGLSAQPGIEVVGIAQDVYTARDKIVRLSPDVLTLDIEMPRMDGVEFLKRLMPQYPIPVVMVSALSREGATVTLEALSAGAIDYVAKPSTSFGNSLDSMMGELAAKVCAAATVDVRKWRQADYLPPSSRPVRESQESSTRVIAIGASTGGTVALSQVVPQFSASVPGVVIVQHMPPVFTAMFAERLNQMSAVEVREAKDGDRILTGQVLIAPGGVHSRVVREGGRYLVRCAEGPTVSGHCPSVDVLMESLAESVGPNAAAAVLTGMGADGASGLKKLRERGGRTIAQDEATSVIFGMPKQAHANGGAERLVPLGRIAAELELLVGRTGR